MTMEPAEEIIARLSIIPFRKITRSDGVIKRRNEIITFSLKNDITN